MVDLGQPYLPVVRTVRAKVNVIRDHQWMSNSDVSESPIVPRVVAITITAVKGLALESRQSIVLGPSGVTANRAFFLVDESGAMLNGKALGGLVRVRADVTDDLGELVLRFPGGEEIRDAVALGPARPVQFFRSQFDAPVVIGPWAAALSEFCGRRVALCRAPSNRPGVDRGAKGTVSMVSTGSLDALRAAGNVPEPVDARRFRMLFVLDGIEPHAEDNWCGRRVSLGSAEVRISGLVGRCAVTTRDPDTGVVDLPTLHYLNLYRGNIRAEERLPFGVYGHVAVPGEVRVGDPVVAVDDPVRLGSA